MSIDQLEFEASLRARIAPLSMIQRAHVLIKLKWRLISIHNIVGAATVMRLAKNPDKATPVAYVRDNYPGLYNKIAPELVGYVSNDRLSREGFDLFFETMFKPRIDAVALIWSEMIAWFRANASPDDINPFE